MEQVKTALEKLVALLTSQRTVTTLVGVVLMLVMLSNAVGVLAGWEQIPLPDEAALQARIAEITGTLALFLTALGGVLGLVFNLQRTIHRDPPTLKRDWATRYSMLPEAHWTGRAEQVILK